MTIAGLIFSWTSCNDPDSQRGFSLSNHDQNGHYSCKDQKIPGLMCTGGSFSCVHPLCASPFCTAHTHSFCVGGCRILSETHWWPHSETVLRTQTNDLPSFIVLPTFIEFTQRKRKWTQFVGNCPDQSCHYTEWKTFMCMLGVCMCMRKAVNRCSCQIIVVRYQKLRCTPRRVMKA